MVKLLRPGLHQRCSSSFYSQANARCVETSAGTKTAAASKGSQRCPLEQRQPTLRSSAKEVLRATTTCMGLATLSGRSLRSAGLASPAEPRRGLGCLQPLRRVQAQQLAAPMARSAHAHAIALALPRSSDALWLRFGRTLPHTPRALQRRLREVRLRSRSDSVGLLGRQR